MTISEAQALQLAEHRDASALAPRAREIRDLRHAGLTTCSRKVFIPLTRLCRDVCHYCTFAAVPRKLRAPYLSIEGVLDICRQGAELGCQEALLTVGEKPELRYRATGAEHGQEWPAAAIEASIGKIGRDPHMRTTLYGAAEPGQSRRAYATPGLQAIALDPAGREQRTKCPDAVTGAAWQGSGPHERDQGRMKGIRPA